jgi:hypothetical protein
LKLGREVLADLSNDEEPRYPTTGIAGCCARAASGHATVDPAIPVMKSRRRIAFPRLGEHTKGGVQLRPSEQEIATSEMGFKVCVLSSNPEPPMTGVGQTRSYGDVGSMSGLPESGHDWAI